MWLQSAYPLHPIPKLLVHAEFDLGSKTLVSETHQLQNSGVWANEYAENARSLYAYTWRVPGDANSDGYDIYMGVSEIQPTAELLGENVRELQFQERNGLYLFMLCVGLGDA